MQSVEHIAMEVFLRQIIREKKNIQELMAEVGYRSSQMYDLLSSIPDSEEKIESFIEAINTENVAEYDNEIDQVNIIY